MKNLILMILVSSLVPQIGLAKKNSKVQEVNFSEMNLKGTIRHPDGAYLVQKRGVKFLPLVQLQQDFDQKIRESNQFIRSAR